MIALVRGVTIRSISFRIDVEVVLAHVREPRAAPCEQNRVRGGDEGER